MKTIAGFLQKIVREEGISCLKDGIRIDGYLADYFPEKKRERSAIRSAMGAGCLTGFCSLAREKDAILREIKLRQMKQRLLAEAWLSEEGANYVIVTFSKALSLPLKEIGGYVEGDDAGERVISDKAEQTDIHEILQWAASKEYAPAQLALGRFYEKRSNMPKAFVWYQRAAVNQDVEAAFRLSQLYRLSGDEKTAALWHEKAARGGHD